MCSYINIMLGLMVIPSLCCIFVHYLESSYTSTMIKVSETAKSKVLQLMQEDGFDPANDYVRVGVKSGGCSGLSYDLKFDKSQIDGDKLFEDNGVKIVVDTKSFLYLIGTTLEYSFILFPIVVSS